MEIYELRNTDTDIKYSESTYPVGIEGVSMAAKCFLRARSVRSLERISSIVRGPEVSLCKDLLGL
jgi:hypothetical protein